MPSPPVSTAELLDLARKSGILSAAKLSAADPDALPPQPGRAAAALVQKKILTKFQAQQLLQGRHKGFKLGPYVILDQLGRGGMGAVYLAEHEDLGRKVAVKVLTPPGDASEVHIARERFMREARSAAALDHPNIVRIFDVARHGEMPYLVMEYVDGDNLQTVIERDGAVAYPQAADFLAQAAAALQHAHERGFVHRDIKPANLMRDRQGVIKILDMGLAKSVTNPGDKLTEKIDPGAIAGTADYIAPEQALGGETDIRADIYSLGATFFALVAGQPPFAGNTTQKLLGHQMKPAPTLVSLDATFPPALSAAVARMLAKKPGDRFAAPADVIGALAPFLTNTGRIHAGLASTAVAAGSQVHAALASRTARLNRPAGGGGGGKSSGSLDFTGPDVVDPSAAETLNETTAPRTAKGPARKPAAPPPARPRRWWPWAAVVAGGVTFGLLLAVLTRPGDKPVDPPPAPEQPAAADGDQGQIPAPQPAPVVPADPKPAAPDADPKPAPPAPPKPPLFRFEPKDVAPFTTRVGLTVSPTDSNKKSGRVVSQTGTVPAGWSVRTYRPTDECELSAAADGQGFAVRNVKGTGSAMLFTPKFDAPGGRCRVAFEYQARGKAGKFKLRFKENGTRPAWDVATLAPTGDRWETADLSIGLNAATGGLLEFHNTDPADGNEFRLRALTISELAADAPLTPLAAAAAAAADPLAGRPDGANVFRFAADGVAPFQVVKEGNQRLSGGPEKLPTGVRATCWKPDAVGEFRCEDVGGVPALGVTCLNDVSATQFSFEVEKQMGVTLEPGRAYRLKVEYQARNDARGTAAVQTADYKTLASAPLAPAPGGWVTARAGFTRGDGPIRVTVDNRSVGEGNILHVRSVEVVEVGP